jgi:uncharacterized membrane protein
VPVDFFDIAYGIPGYIVLALLALKMWAFVDAILRPAQAYLATDKQTKTAWLWILGLTFATQLLFPYPTALLSLVGDVAAIVYIVDVKPALAAVTRRR